MRRASTIRLLSVITARSFAAGFSPIGKRPPSEPRPLSRRPLSIARFTSLAVKPLTWRRTPLGQPRPFSSTYLRTVLQTSRALSVAIFFFYLPANLVCVVAVRHSPSTLPAYLTMPTIGRQLFFSFPVVGVTSIRQPYKRQSIMPCVSRQHLFFAPALESRKGPSRLASPLPVGNRQESNLLHLDSFRGRLTTTEQRRVYHERLPLATSFFSPSKEHGMGQSLGKSESLFIICF